jgi:hypothetical protein
MDEKAFSKDHWLMVQQLAAELAQRRVDDNLTRTAAAYMKAHPNADLIDWLHRLVQLGDLFSSSDQTERYRHELWAACERLRPQPSDGATWAQVLSWAGRLQKYYEDNPRLAQRVSDVSHVTLPPKPPQYRPPKQERNTEPDIPDVPEEASDAAQDMYSKLRALWGKKDGD